MTAPTTSSSATPSLTTAATPAKKPFPVAKLVIAVLVVAGQGDQLGAGLGLVGHAPVDDVELGVLAVREDGPGEPQRSHGGDATGGGAADRPRPDGVDPGGGPVPPLISIVVLF